MEQTSVFSSWDSVNLPHVKGYFCFPPLIHFYLHLQHTGESFPPLASRTPVVRNDTVTCLTQPPGSRHAQEEFSQVRAAQAPLYYTSNFSSQTLRMLSTLCPTHRVAGVLQPQHLRYLTLLIGKSKVLDGQILLSTTSSINGGCISLNLSCQDRAPGPRQIGRGVESVSEHFEIFRQTMSAQSIARMQAWEVSRVRSFV